jgi:hypothetical protein
MAPNSEAKSSANQMGPGREINGIIDYLDLNGSKKMAFHLNSTPTGAQWLAPISRPYNNDWYQVVYVKHGSKYSAYVNGVLENNSTGPATLPDSTGRVPPWALVKPISSCAAIWMKCAYIIVP